MFSLIKDLGFQVALRQEAASLLIALVIAEFLYKFQSFLLECIAFLLTWFVLSFIQSFFISRRKQTSPP